MNNQSAIEFYKKFGFEIVETKQQYYKRIEPADAHVLEKNLKKHSNNGEVVTSSVITANINCSAVEMNGLEDNSLQNINALQSQQHQLHGKSKV